MNVRRYKPIRLINEGNDKFVRHPTNQKLSNARLDMIATYHRLPRISSAKLSLQRSFSRINQQTFDGQYKDRNKLPDILDLENNFSRCVSVPNISSELDEPEKSLYGRTGFKTTAWETFEAATDNGTDNRNTGAYNKYDFEKEDPEITDIMLGQDNCPSLGQRERELELCEIIPQQVWKRDKVIGYNPI